ncbi:MAG: hypothetical protein JWP46_530 [Modestobacter sp.]|nr:hypothetical protein [Modestobacter sp.]
MRSEERRPAHARAELSTITPVSQAQVEGLDWSWPPYAPVEPLTEPFDTAQWAPSSTVWHPQLRVGRWTVLYRRSA